MDLYRQRLWALTRGELDLPLSRIYPDTPQRSLKFWRVKGLTDFWSADENQRFEEYFADLLAGLHGFHGTVAYLLLFRQAGFALYIGASADERLDLAGTLRSSLEASYPYIDLVEDRPALEDLAHYGGLLCGHPVRKSSTDRPALQVERLLQAMHGASGGYLVLARSIALDETILAQSQAFEAIEEATPHLKLQVSFGAQDAEMTNVTAERYIALLNQLVERLAQGRSRGMWSTAAYYFAPSPAESARLQALLISLLGGEMPVPEPVRALPSVAVQRLVSCFSFPNNQVAQGDPQGHPVYREVDSFRYLYRTALTSSDLAVMMQIPRLEVPGYYLNPYVRFDVAQRHEQGDFPLGTILDMGRETCGRYALPLDDLTRHTLVVGVTGGGKSNTVRTMLRTLWKEHRKPFLVIESAKQEYWELRALPEFQDLLVFTLGVETANAIPYRLNPFEVLPGTTVQTHIDYLMSIFKASFELWEPLPHILERAVHEVYESYGWSVTENTNILGRSDFPRLTDLYYKMDEVVDSLGYDHRLQSDIKGAIKTRINSLRVGGKGRMMDVPRSVPLEVIMHRPVVFELEEIGDDDVKAFMIGALLVQLHEYRRKEGPAKELRHVTFVEEAHRLLQYVPEAAGNSPRAKAVQFFCNMLAEIRSYGEGIMIADQIPTKLASETVRNTNLKIVHRIVAEDDRRCVGGAMNMTDEQVQYLSTLGRGVAAVYSEGNVRPLLVRFPLMELPGASRADELARIRQQIQVDPALAALRAAQRLEAGPFIYCTHCPSPCAHRRRVLSTLSKHPEYAAEARRLLPGDPVRLPWIREHVEQGLFGMEADRSTIAFCYVAHLLDSLPLPLADRKTLARSFARKLVEGKQEAGGDE